MKQLVVIAFCLFSIFTIHPIHVHAIDCKAGYDGKAIQPGELKNCEGVKDGTEPDIFDHLIWTNTFLFFITCILFVFGINLSKKKKEPTKKERLLIDIFCWSPFVSIFFFYIIKGFENLM